MLRRAALLGYLLLVFVGGGLVAPWVWWAAQALAAAGTPGWGEMLTGHPFHRYVHRCLLGLALAGLWPLGRALGCRTWRDVGLGLTGGGAAAGRDWFRGTAFAGMMFLGALGWEIGDGDRLWRGFPGGAEFVGIGARALASGIAVGLVEEVLFRGVLCGGLARWAGWGSAMVVSSALYSIVHLFRRPPRGDTVTWLSGLEMVGGMISGIGERAALVPGGLTLFAAGLLLAWLYRRTGALYLPMGLHAGWVFWGKMRDVLTVRPPGVSDGGADGPAWGGWPVLVVTAAALLAAVGWEAGRWRKATEGIPERVSSGSGTE